MTFREWMFKFRAVVLLPLAVILIVFAKPTFFSLLTGLVVALFGEGLRVWGAGFVGDKSRDVIVQARELIIAGPYRFVRNPLYIANTIMALGFVIIAGGLVWDLRTWFLLGVVIGGYIFVYGNVVPHEESFLLKQYGEKYEAYLKVVPRWLPRFSPCDINQGTYSWRDIRKAEIHTVFLLVFMAVVMAVKVFDL